MYSLLGDGRGKGFDDALSLRLAVLTLERLFGLDKLESYDAHAFQLVHMDSATHPPYAQRTNLGRATIVHHLLQIINHLAAHMVFRIVIVIVKSQDSEPASGRKLLRRCLVSSLNRKSH